MPRYLGCWWDVGRGTEEWKIGLGIERGKWIPERKGVPGYGAVPTLITSLNGA